MGAKGEAGCLATSMITTREKSHLYVCIRNSAQIDGDSWLGRQGGYKTVGASGVKPKEVAGKEKKKILSSLIFSLSWIQFLSL
jgi:hypothetical protein